MTLTDRIAEERRDNLRVLRPSEPVPFRPAWMRRMQQQGLPVQDRTAYIHGSYTPRGSGEAA